ncbi:uncharacterized protein LOC113278735 [Papaver somniferum]|uniref:uncharacterized protein LOC113278735 n=1 Tax=Papaver somniferum TaxID=3469 RepID=UPI000E70070D|nr:uncharacterized protein LOC113278735 [Papaver somniferum]
MSLKILSWNVRGLCSNDRRLIVKKMIGLLQAPIVILQETKMMRCSDHDIQQICGHSNFGWTFQQSVGNSGGMIILWDKYFLEVKESLVGDYSLSIYCVNKHDGFVWVLTNIYGPNKPHERADFWEELDNICGYLDLPWCLGGDFNTIKCCDEKKNCNTITKSMKDFAEFISQHNLIDLPLKGARYTWSNGQTNP